MNYTTFLREISIDSPMEAFGRFMLISSGAAYFCKANDLKTVGDLLAYHHRHYYFTGNLPNCTPSIEKSLMAFCQQYWHLRKGVSMPQHAPVLDEVQFENFVRYMRKITKHASSPIGQLISREDPAHIYQEYIQGDKSVYFLVNGIRGRSLNDFEAIRNELRAYAALVLDQPAGAEFDQLVETCVKHYGCTETELEVFRPLADAGNFPLFGFVAYLMDCGSMFPQNEKQVLEHGLGYFKGDIMDDDSKIMKSLGIGTIGLEKMKKDMPNTIFNKLQYLRSHAAYIKRQSKYNFDTDAALFFLTEAEAERINIAEEANFQPSFITTLIWAMFNPDNQLVHFNQGGFRNNFLVKKDIAEAFNFGAFFLLLGPDLLNYHNNGKWPELMNSINRFFKGPSIVYRSIVVQILTQIAKEYVMFARANWQNLNAYLVSEMKSVEPDPVE